MFLVLGMSYDLFRALYDLITFLLGTIESPSPGRFRLLLVLLLLGFI